MEIEYIPERPISIYALICRIENEIKYIGASYDVERRFRSHLNNKCPNKKMKVWMDKLKERDLMPICQVLEIITSRIDASQRELFYIEKHRETIVNGDYKLKLPLESISSSKDDKYKVSFYLTKERLDQIVNVLRKESPSLDWSFYKIISQHTSSFSWSCNEKIKWSNTPRERKINL